MSQQNVERARQLYERNTPKALIDSMDEGCIWISDPQMPAGGTYRGRDNVRAYLDELFVFEDGTIDVHEIHDLGDRTLGVTTFRAKPPEGPAVEWTWCQLITWDRGLITELRSFLDRDRALEAAGLSE